MEHHSRDEILRTLTEAGIQASAPRMAIASFVWNTDTHPTAEEVKEEVEKSFPMVSLATVYNTLNLFVEKGLLKEVPDPLQRSVRYDCNTHPHFHFVDISTGRIYDLPSEFLEIKSRLADWDPSIKIQEMEVTLRGHRPSQAPHLKSSKKKTSNQLKEKK